MGVQVGCPQCGTTLSVPETAQGKQVRCPSCETVMAIPAPKATTTQASLTIGCSCGAKLKVLASARGKKVRCSKCQSILAVPAGGPRTAAASPTQVASQPPTNLPADPFADPASDPFGAPTSADAGLFNDLPSAANTQFAPNATGGAIANPHRASGTAKKEKQTTKKRPIRDFLYGKKHLMKALAEHVQQTGLEYVFIDAAMPPLRLWIKNRKGDKWAKVYAPDGSLYWMRYRQRLFSKKSPLTFFKD